MSNCINLDVTKQTPKQAIVDFLAIDQQYHTFKIGREDWTLIDTFYGCGHLVNCHPKELGDWYYDDELDRMKSVFDECGDDFLAMIGNPWHSYLELADEIINYAQTV